MISTDTCPNCDASVPADCDGSGEVICSECGEEVGHIGCSECMLDDDDEDFGGGGGERLAAYLDTAHAFPLTSSPDPHTVMQHGKAAATPH